MAIKVVYFAIFMFNKHCIMLSGQKFLLIVFFFINVNAI